MRDLTKDRELCEKATPGPWKHWFKGMDLSNGSTLDGAFDNCVMSMAFEQLNIGPVFRDADAQFIAEAREALPHYLAETQRLTAEVERLRGALKGIIDELTQHNCYKDCKDENALILARKALQGER